MSANFHLRRVHLGNVRKFAALQIDGLGQGLNIIGGPNGIGKSSLARAIRASFLDKHNSSSANDLQPLGGSGGGCTVALDFDWKGQPYQLKKSFVKQKRCHLSQGSTSLEGQDAEDHLAALMGYTHGAKGSSVANWGVPGLLWVEQGFDPKEFATRVGYAGQRLGGALHAQSLSSAEATDASVVSSAAQLAATAGDALIAQLEGELAQYLGVSGSPIGEYRQQLDKLQALKAQHTEQHQRIQDYRNQVDELEQLLAQAQQEQAAPPQQAWQAQLDQALAQQQALHTLAQQQAQDQQLWQQGQERLKLLAQALQQHAKLQQQLAQREEAVAHASAELAQASQRNAQARDAVDAALAQRAAAQAAWERAQHAKARQEVAQHLAQLQQEEQRLSATLHEAEQAQIKVQQLVLEGYAFNIHTADLQLLRKLEDAVTAATLKRDALATQLHYTLPPDQALHWQAAAEQGQWQGQGEVWLDRPFTVQLPGGGQLRITPGGGDVAQATLALDAALASRHAAWLKLGVHSLAQAQEQFDKRQQQLIALQVEQQLLENLAPQGIEALRLAHTQLQAQIEQQRKQLQTMPEVAGGTDWAQAHRHWVATQAATEAAQQAQQAQLQAYAALAQRLESAHAECAAVRSQLEDPQALARYAEHQTEVLLLQAKGEALQTRIAQQQARLQGQDAHFVAQDIARLQNTLRSHAEQVQQRSSRIVALRAALEVAGAQGLEESSAQLAGDIQRLQRRVDEAARRAQALKTLVERLKAKRTAALRRLQAPLQARMRHYLQLLLPGGTVELSEQLVPVHVLADSASTDPAAQRVVGAIDKLSYGTQEQLSIISRLAYADLLNAAGHPTLVMLDDALVHSDAQRLAQMKRVLFDAATRHQILLLTCRPQDWQDAGVPVRSLPV